MSTYQLSLAVVRRLRSLIQRIGRHDRNLADQLRRAATSIPLNINEGLYSRGGNRSARLNTAMASAKECEACLDAAEALGYLGPDDVSLDELDHLAGSLWLMVHRPHR